MESQEHILSTIEDGVLTLTLNRPEKLNALTQEMYAALSAGLDQANESDEIGAVLIAARGDNFSAGNDLKDFMAMAMSFGQEGGGVKLDQIPVIAFLKKLANFEKPLVVVIQGQAVGVGLTLALHADYVCLADTAMLSAPFVDLGLVPEAGSSMLLAQRVGSARASEILLAGSRVDAKSALDWGLVNQVTTADDCLDSARSVAKTLASKPREAMKLSKQLIHHNKEALNAHMDKEFATFFARVLSDEAKAAFAAFLNR